MGCVMAADPSIKPPPVTDAIGRFSWVATMFGALVVGGLVLVLWAVVNGRARDVAASPYHVPFYLGLGSLAVLCGVRAVRAQRRGLGWRRAMPEGFGLLGVGVATVALALILDVGWREGVGIVYGIEEGFAPSRVVLVVGLGMIAVAPLRAGLLLGAGRVPRLAMALSASLTLVALGWPGGLHVAESAWLAVDPDLPQTRADLWVMDADGSRQTRLIEMADWSHAGYASWSPDGARIGYTVFRVAPAGIAASEASLWTAGADGREAMRFDRSDEWRWIPRFTPDGAWLLFTQEAQGGPWMEEGPVGPGAAVGPQGPLSVALPHADIWRVASSGDGVPERLTEDAGDDRAPVPSPDGSLILFDSTRDGNTELYVMDVDGASPRRLTDDPGEDWGGSWSPDGSQIAFNSSRTGDMEIYVMDADGSDVRQMTFDRGTNVSPTWSPDGTRIAFTTRSANDYGQIWSIDTDGGDRRNLSRSPSTDDQSWTGAWGPDGRLVFVRTLPPPPEATPLVRLDFGTAGMLLTVALTAAIVVLLARTAPPLGTFTLVLGLATTLLAATSEEWRFVPTGFVAGIAADAAAWLGPSRLRGRLTAAVAGATLVLASAVAALATTGLEWTPTLVLGIALAAGALGWGIGSLAESPTGTDTVPP